MLDNRTEKVSRALEESLRKGSGLSILTDSFSIWSYLLLKRQLHKVDRMRLLISSSPYRSATGSGAIFSIPGLQGEAGDRRHRNTLNLAKTAMECAQWLESKADIKFLESPNQPNLICVENKDGTVVIHGSSAFTTPGLGFAPSDGPQMSMMFTEPHETVGMLKWYDTVWNDEAMVRDIKEEFLDQLQEMYRSRPPEQIYYLTLHHLFKDFLGEYDEDKILRSRTGIKDTLIWKKLYRFQRDGVMGAIDKIEKHNGCIIADSVGLGKTFEALAIIKYYELRNDRVLVLCPKKLRENWTLYIVNDRRNGGTVVSKDTFRGAEDFEVIGYLVILDEAVSASGGVA